MNTLKHFITRKHKIKKDKEIQLVVHLRIQCYKINQLHKKYKIHFNL
jgi:hypothetical protein